MKTVGLLGGMSWESTVPYYQIINRTVAERLGGLHSARILLHSVDFHDVERMQPFFELTDRMSAVDLDLPNPAAGAEGEPTTIPFVEHKPIMQPFGDRSKVVIEPMLTDQWFVDAETLAGPALEAVKTGATRFAQGKGRHGDFGDI